MDTRILIAVLVSLAAVFAYQELVLKRLYPPPNPQATARLATPGSTGTPTSEAQAERAPSVAPSLASASGGPEKTVEVDTDLYDALLTSRGGRLKSFKLKKYKETSKPDSPPLEMVKPAPGGDLPLGVVINFSDSVADDRDVQYQTTAPAQQHLMPGQRATLTFLAHTAAGLNITKTIEFSDSSYALNMNVDVQSTARQLTSVGLEVSQPLTAHKGYYDVPEVQAMVDDKALVKSEKDLRKGVPPMIGKVTYAGFGDRYFLFVYLPQTSMPDTLKVSFDGNEALSELLFPVSDRRAEIRTLVYAGPKELSTLESINPALAKSINFGWTGILGLTFLRALKLFHRLTPNYGVDIILLTVGIRILFLPMSIKSQRSMMRLQRLQPQVEKIREKHKDDTERLNKEMVDLYRRNHVNPLGGCAPMLLQLPIFIGLYYALLNAVELRHAPFIGWIQDLSAPDCLRIAQMPAIPGTECGGIPVLVLLMGASTFLQQWMAPAAADPNQQRMMMIMPLLFIFMFVNFPAGLSLYYFTSNMLGIAQQYVLNREFKQLSPVNA